ncbi:MAG: NAD(P)/FAD-dependent oxidoreductase [Armatimonadetes bacterium]|nr:NAD(P)/FAD-dependent oxidoreductase [Armatimonadota bacterium]
MPEKSMAIIGAGLAGLSAGCYAQMNGYRARIFEHHGQPGGVAAAWRRGDYLFDGGIHFLMGAPPGQPLFRLYEELGVADAARHLGLDLYLNLTDETSGRSVTVTRDLDRLARDLRALSPGDAPAIDELIAGTRAMQRSGFLDLEMGRPRELGSPLAPLRQLWSMRRALRLFGGKFALPVSEYARRHVQDHWLRFVLEGLFMPEVPVWFLFMILGLLAEGRIGLLERGSLAFARDIEARFRELGGEVTYHATVARILVEGDRAVGVRLEDGSEHRADVVISAADGRATLFEMLEGRYLDAATKERYRSWPRIRPMLMINYGVRREFPGEPWERILRLAEPLAVGPQAVSLIGIRLFNYSAHFAPPGKRVAQVAFDADWDYWHGLREQDGARYEAEKARVASDALARLERHYPGIAAQVEETDVATPHTTWRYTRNYGGAYMGWMPTPKAIMTTLPRTLRGLDGFTMAGQWVVPGGGVPPSLYSGRHAVEIACRLERRRFTTRT